ncbi:MAG: hypothetical protein NWF00_09130 [Candidatus Bathyarchaeota archaeon]|nr:hypothetical protein [Candidatus Bathyarchaeota archaeon]
MKKKTKLEQKQKTETTADEKVSSGSSMPTFQCSCGERILVVPDLAAMDRALKNHMRIHKGIKARFLAEEVVKAVSLHTANAPPE